MKTNWEEFISGRIPEILDNSELRYGKYVVSYSSKLNEFLKTYLVSRGKRSLDKVLKVNVNIRNTQPTSKEFGNIVLEDVPLAKLPIVTDNGIVIKGTKYFYVNEIKQADGWYILSNKETNDDDDALKKLNTFDSDDYDSDLEVPTFDSDFESNSDEFDSDELDSGDILDTLESKLNEINDEPDISQNENEEETEDEETDLSKEDESISVHKNKYSTYLLYRGPFAKYISFSMKENKDGTKSFKVQFQSNKRKRTVSWFTFLKAILPGLSAEEIVELFDGLPIITEAYVSALHNYSVRAGSGKKREPSIEASNEECALYCLSEFFLTKKGNKFLNGVENPLSEFLTRLNTLKCDTSARNKDIFSFSNLKGYILRKDLISSGLSIPDLNTLNSKIKIPAVGDVLSQEQLIILDSFDNLKSLTVSCTPDSKSFVVYKPNKKDNLCEEIVDMFRHYLLVCEGIGNPFEMDSFKNKEIETLEKKLELSISKTLFEFNESLMNTLSTREQVDSVISENEFSKCFEKDINKGYRDLLKSIHESSNYQNKDDTNSLAEYSQTMQLKYGVKNAPMSLRSLSSDQYGFVCPQTTSEGGNVGLNIYRTTDTFIDGSTLKKRFYAIDNGQFIVEDGGIKIVSLSAGEVERNLVMKYNPDIINIENIDEDVECYCGSRKTRARLRNISFMEMSDGQNVSPLLAIITGANNNGGKRGTMGPNQEKQSQPLLLPKRSMVDTGVFEHENIGVIRAEQFIKKALVEIGELGYSDSITDDWSIVLEKSIQKDYASKIEYSVIPPAEVASSSKDMGSLIQKLFYYDIPALTPTVKRSLKHYIPVVNDSNVYKASDIVVRAGDVDVSPHDASGVGYLGVTESNFGPAGGTQLRVAFSIYEGFGYEDAIIINEDSVLSGAISTMTYFNIIDEIKITGDDEKDAKFGKPQGYNIDYLADNGLPKKGTTLGVGDIVISKLNPSVSGGIIERVPSYTRLKEGSKDRGCVVSSSIEEYQKEDGFTYLRATVSLMYISNPALGTKFSGGHGNKGVVSKIVPACMMPYDEEGNRADIILNSTGSLPRNNLGQFTEIIKNTIGIKTNTVQLIKPFEKWDILGLLKDAECHGIVPKRMYDGVTGKPFDRDILVGYMTIFRSEHDVKGKFNSCSLDGNLNSNSLTVARGPGGAQRLGEMSSWALIAKDAFKYIDSMFTVQGGDFHMKEAYKNALKNGESPDDLEMQGDNRLNILSKIRYLMMGTIFEDYNKNTFKPLNSEVIEMSDSPFIVSNKYDIEDYKVYGLESTNASPKSIAEYQTFKYARCVDMHKRIIYPIYIESSFLLNNMWYLKSTAKEDNCLYSVVSSLISSNWEKPNFCEIQGLNCLSNITSKDLLNKSKLVVWVKGMRLPILLKTSDYNTVRDTLKDISGYDKTKYEECVKVHKGYSAILSLILGYNFDIDDNVDNTKCSKNGSLLESLVLKKLISALGAEEEPKFGVTSYNFGDFFKDTLGFAEMMGYDKQKVSALVSLFEKIEKVSDDYARKVEEEKKKPADERQPIENINVILMKYVCNEFNSEFPELSDLDSICSIQRYDLYKEISCRYFWVPPRVFRGDSVGGNPSQMKKLITGLVKEFSEYSDSFNNTNYTTSIFNRLSTLNLYCIDELKNHSNKNAILRDQVMSVRVNCSSRGYITVDPTLGMDEVGLPIHHAAGIFQTFLHQISGYNSDSCLYYILSSLEDTENVSTDVALKHKKTKSEIIKFLSSDNRNSFMQALRSNKHYKAKLLELVAETGSAEKAETKLFDNCRNDLIKRLEELLSIHPVSLERAPTFWKYSIQAFWGKLRFNCHSIALCPLVCRAFNADFDGDQMSQTIAIDKGAIEEQKELMMPSSNLINVSDGKLIQNLNQDMALGIYWLTIERQNKLSASRIDGVNEDSNYVVRELEVPVASYCDVDALRTDIELGFIKPHDYIVFRSKVKGKQRFYKDTAGRILFNGLIPELSDDGSCGFTDLRRAVKNNKVVLVVDSDSPNVEYLDEFYVLYTDTVNLKCIRNKDLQSIANNIARTRDKNIAKEYLESVMRLGFKMAHLSGVSISLYDFREIISNSSLKKKVEDLQTEVEEVKRTLELGFITDEEYKLYLVSRFNKSETDFADYLQSNLSRYSNLYLLIDSGARGSFKQLVAQSVMVGLPTDANGEVIPEPIFGNYAEGLNSTEYFNTSYVARQALVTGSMYTGNIGEVLRTMIYQCEHNAIQYDYNGEDFCDSESTPIPLRYEVKLPTELDLDLIDLIPSSSDMNWNKLISELGQIAENAINLDLSVLFKQLLVDYQIKEFFYSIKGSSEVSSAKVSYKLTDYCKNLIMLRTIDMDKWSRIDKCFNAGAYYTVDNSTIEQLEFDIAPSINIYLAMNCKHTSGICRKCFGVTHEFKVPKRYSNVGIESAQSIGQVSSQLALDSHKSSGGSPLSNFSSFVKILRQQNLGSQVFVAPISGIFELSLNTNKTEASLRVVNSKGVSNLGTYAINADVSFFKYNNGDYVNAGDILHYNRTLNYSKMRSYMECIDLGDLKCSDKCKLNVLKEIVDLYDCDLSIRHFDILLRDLTRFSISTETKIVDGELYVAGGVYQTSELEDNGISSQSIIVSSLKSMQLNNKHASSMAMSYLRKQIGNASALKKESITSPLNCLLGGICLEDVYGENTLTEEELAEKYASRRYGENINISEDKILAKYNDIKSKNSVRKFSLGKLSNKKTNKEYLNFDTLVKSKEKEVKSIDVSVETNNSSLETNEQVKESNSKEKTRTRDRIILHNRPDTGKRSEIPDKDRNIREEDGVNKLNANETHLFG